jgi:hypothetical protein
VDEEALAMLFRSKLCLTRLACSKIFLVNSSFLFLAAKQEARFCLLEMACFVVFRSPLVEVDPAGEGAADAPSLVIVEDFFIPAIVFVCSCC